MEVANTARKINKEVKKKKCPICGQEKNISTGFYKSSSPLYADDGCVPICITCVKKSVLNDDGTVNENKLKTMCQRLDKPFYTDELDSAFLQTRSENSYLSNDEVAKQGNKIVGFYFKNINTLRQNKNKSFADSEQEGFIHKTSNANAQRKKDQLINRYNNVIGNDSHQGIEDEEKAIIRHDDDDFEITDDIIRLFGEGYTKSEYRKMYNKYENLKLNYSIQTNLHQEALATYVRFKVKEEDATAKGDVAEAMKWYTAAQNAAENGKLTPKQLSESDLHGGINSFSEIFKAVEQAVDIIPILPSFKFRPNDALDFTIWCYINYARDLQGLPQCSYEDVYKFYDKKKQEYIDQYGDPNGIFDDDPAEDLRDSIKKFITLPSDYSDGDE